MPAWFHPYYEKGLVLLDAYASTMMAGPRRSSTCEDRRMSSGMSPAGFYLPPHGLVLVLLAGLPSAPAASSSDAADLRGQAITWTNTAAVADTASRSR